MNVKDLRYVLSVILTFFLLVLLSVSANALDAESDEDAEFDK